MTTTSVKDKIGQMLMGGFDGLTAPDYFLDWLREGRLGGVILFSRNVESPQQLAALTRELHAAAKFPLLISIDQEGGTVARLRDGFSESPGARALASIRDNTEAIIEDVSYVLAAEMAALGINWTYAPVVDVTYNADNPTVGTRSFGTDPEEIATLAAAAVRGFQRGGVAACAKHFPGLGDTAIDTHLALPRLNTPLDKLRAVDLMPYHVTIANGLATIMTTHTIFTTLDSEYPATMSPVVIQRLLRDELDFQGVVTTDCMEMKAIDDNYPIAESVVAAALAGVDIILFSHTAEKQAEAYENLLAAVEDGRVPLSIVDAANERVARLKQQFPAATGDIEEVSSTAHHEIMLNAARAAISQLRIDDNLLPLKPDSDQTMILVEFSPSVESIVQETTNPSHLGYYVKQRLPNIQTILLPARPTQDDYKALLDKQADILILATRNAHLTPAQAEAVRYLAGHPARIVLLALRNPYDAQLIESGTVLCSAGDSRPSLEAMAEALTGDIVPTGRLADEVWH